MASLVLSFLCFPSQKPSCSFTSSSLRFTIGAPIESSFGGASLFVGFGLVNKKRNGRIKVSGDSRSASPLVFRDLEADDFRHPIDKQNTLLLRAIPGLDGIGIRPILETVTEEIRLNLENLGTSYSTLVSKDQRPELHEMMIEAAEILNMDPPDLYVCQNDHPYAYTLAPISSKNPYVVVHSGLVELLTRKELQAALAHELGHLKCDHGVWLAFGNLFTIAAYCLPEIAGFISIEEQRKLWHRSAELTCDRASLLVAQDPKVVISLLMKLDGDYNHTIFPMDKQHKIDCFLERGHSYIESSPRNGQAEDVAVPLPVVRAREIDDWSRSREYRRLLESATQMSV